MPKLVIDATQYHQVSRLLKIAMIFTGDVVAINDSETVLLFKFPDYSAVENFYSIISKDPVKKITTLMGESYESSAYVSVVV